MPDSMRNFIATFKDGDECSGSIVQEAAGGRSIQVLLADDCVAARQLPASLFSCAESMRTQYRDLVIVARAMNADEDKIFCWVFPHRPRAEFYLLEGNDCNEAVRRRIRNSRFEPVVTFSKRRLRDSTVIPDDDDDEEDSGLPKSSPPAYGHPSLGDGSRPDVFPANRTEENPREAGEEEQEGGINATPYVVLATVLIFALFQIPCMCKASS
jgi:hypothetical protein